MSYIKDAAKGVSWMSLFRVLYRAIGVARIAIIAHILTPSSLGVFGIVAVVLAFLEIITETGINIFLIQEREDSDKYINTAWFVSIIRGIVISVAIYTIAGPISQFFNSAESFSLLRWASLIPLIRGFINPSIVKFQKDLHFNKEFAYRISVFLVESVISVSIVMLTKNPFSLVLGLIGGAVFEVLFTFLVAKPLPKFEFDRVKTKKVINRGKWVTLFGVFDYLYTQCDNIIVGRMLGVDALGIYQNAYKISTAPLTEVGDVFFRVTFPVFSKMSDDKDRLKKAFIQNTIVNTLLMVPAGIVIFAFAELIVNVLLGPGWEAAVPVTKLLSVLGVVRGIASSTNSLMVSRGLQKYSAIVTIVSTIGMFATIVPLTKSYGIIGAGSAAIIGTLVSVPLTIYFVGKTLKAIALPHQ